jgi:hypothetical protein
VPLIVKAIHFDVLRGQHSVGAHVRDAACYVCWAFARAYSPAVMMAHIRALSSAMLLVSLFDREINCRRAASAAFQENVGRQGNESFPHGIEIITIADYFSVGNRNAAFMKLASAIALFDVTICESFLYHLKSSCLIHWDEELRVLSSKAIARLAVICPDFGIASLGDIVGGCLSNKINYRHGNILATSEMLFALTTNGLTLPAETIAQILEIPAGLEKGRLFRGRGGELIRYACCYLIEYVSKSGVALASNQKAKFIDILNENLRQPFEGVQKAAASAIRQFLYTYFSSSVTTATETTLSAVAEKIQKLTVLKYMEGLLKEDNVAATRGYALALGALPVSLVTCPPGRFEEVVRCVAQVSSSDWLICGESDASTRSYCIDSLVELAEKVYPYASHAVTAESVGAVLDVLRAGSRDYSVDKRGDTGSWCRIVAIQGMERLLGTLSMQHAPLLSQSPSPVPIDTVGAPLLSAIDPAPAVAVGSILLLSYGIGRLVAYEHVNSVYCVISVSFSPQSLGYMGKEVESVLKVVIKTEQLASFVVPPPLDHPLRCAPGFSVMLESAARAVFESLLKQLAEKLDAVRDVAGNILMRLLKSKATAASAGGGPDFPIPDMALILSSLKEHLQSFEQIEASGTSKEFSLEDCTVINWSQPTHVFPVVVALLASDVYFYPILSGLIISIGGLTEAVHKESARAMVSFFVASKEEGRSERLQLLTRSLLQIFADNEKVDRVIVPLLKTTEIVIRNAILETFQKQRRDATLEGIQQAIADEMKSSPNVPKLMACIDVLSLLLWFNGPVRYLSLQHLINTLIHKYPRVRVCKSK